MDPGAVEFRRRTACVEFPRRRSRRIYAYAVAVSFYLQFFDAITEKSACLNDVLLTKY